VIECHILLAQNELNNTPCHEHPQGLRRKSFSHLRSTDGLLDQMQATNHALSNSVSVIVFNRAPMDREKATRSLAEHSFFS